MNNQTKEIANNNAEVSLQEHKIYASLDIPEEIMHILNVYDVIKDFRNFFVYTRFNYPLATSEYFLNYQKDNGIKEFTQGLEVMKDYDGVLHNLLEEIFKYYVILNEGDKIRFLEVTNKLNILTNKHTNSLLNDFKQKGLIKKLEELGFSLNTEQEDSK